MKIFHKQSHIREQGSATILVLALIGIMLLVVGANIMTLNNLKSEMKLIDKKQTQRLENQSKAEAGSRSR